MPVPPWTGNWQQARELSQDWIMNGQVLMRKRFWLAYPLTQAAHFNSGVFMCVIWLQTLFLPFVTGDAYQPWAMWGTAPVHWSLISSSGSQCVNTGTKPVKCIHTRPSVIIGQDVWLDFKKNCDAQSPMYADPMYMLLLLLLVQVYQFQIFSVIGINNF